MQKKFLKLLLSSQTVLITSHISPDPDAVSSALLLATTLQQNYPEKVIKIILEEEPTQDLSFLAGYVQIKFQPLTDSLEKIRPDLLILLDAGAFKRVSRNDSDQVKGFVQQHNVKTIVIDHHEAEGKDIVDVYINNKRPATAEEVYVLCFDDLKLNKPKGYAQTALLGIISDTQRHKFDHPGYRETFRVVSELLDAGASIEKLENELESYNKNELEALSHLASNMKSSGKGYSYTFITDEFAEEWRKAKKSHLDLKKACELFGNQFIRNFENNKWGFLVYPDSVGGEGYYGVSFRSLVGVKDVAEVARQLGGGGHKPAAGAKLTAKTTKDAIKQVTSLVDE
ncbi:DHH family phosphoesterase [Candidatus Saccharibacteria bacterium]|nr:DHH family phosphoesterase [Candidatus Saccharibacteria bacterium]